MTYIKLAVTTGYFPWMIARDYLGNANLYTQIIRESDGSFLNATNSKTLKAGEILLVPKSGNPPVNPPVRPEENPVVAPNDPPKEEDSGYLLWFGLGALMLIMMTGKKGRKKK
jgi:hypothetical protein